MHTFKAIGWFIWLVVNLHLVYAVIGYAGLTRMFPEGKRWWHLPAECAVLVLFAVTVQLGPWNWTP